MTLKRKSDNLTSPARLKAPVSLMSPDRLKLTLKGELRVEKKKISSSFKLIEVETHNYHKNM